MTFCDQLAKVAAGGMLLLVLSACATATPIPTLSYPAEQPKQLATVALSPTPDEAARAATQHAAPLQTRSATLVPTLTPTAYIGVFLGEAANAEGPAMSLGFTDPQPISTPATVSISQCGVQPDAAFGTLWTSNASAVAQLGCPSEEVARFDGTLQIFERGAMYWRNNSEIWVVAPLDERYWFVASAPATQPGEINAPAGLRPPAPTFGTVWRDVEGVRAALGFGRTDEQPAKIVLQRFQGGALWADATSGQTFILLADGRLAGPY